MELTGTRAVALALLAVMVLSGAATTGAGAQERQVGNCTVIDEPGTYTVSDDIVNASVNATENDTAVNVTDGNATTTNGTDANLTAANATGANATTGNETQANRTSSGNTFSVDDRSAVGCVAIRSDDVVLEGNGSQIDGTVGPNGTQPFPTGANATAANVTDTNETQPRQVGIAIVPADQNDTIENVSVRNVTVTQWDVGVYSHNPRNVTYENLSSYDNAGTALRVVDDAAENESVDNETVGNGSASTGGPA